jgi:geranylgeranyl pyrophosphate synthase
VTTVNFFAPVQNLLVEVEAVMQAQALGQHPDLGAALEHLLASGGKRVRPAITLLTGGIFGAPSARLVTLAAAIELLHTATLVHDDLIDGALLRRGMTTLNAQWSPAATVLTGDFMFARAARLAAAADSLPVMHLFSETLATIVNGEITQLFESRGHADLDNYYRRIYAKTASMFELATAAPAMLAAVPETAVETARRFGFHLGMAFQIVDDILDFTAEQGTLGKPVASDLRQGLVTLPALRYLELAPDDPDMAWVLAGKSFPEATVERLVAAIRRSGAIAAAQDEAVTQVQQARQALQELPATPERAALADLADYMTARQL